MQNIPSQGLRRVYSSDLMVITEDKEFKERHLMDKFSTRNSQFLLSPKSKLTEKENFNLNKMTSQELKKSVESNPFMRAKLKCLIKTTQKSLNKQNELHSPKFVPKPKFQQLSNMFNARVLEKQRRQKQKMKLANFQKFMTENQSHKPNHIIGTKKLNQK